MKTETNIINPDELIDDSNLVPFNDLLIRLRYDGYTTKQIIDCLMTKGSDKLFVKESFLETIWDIQKPNYNSYLRSKRWKEIKLAVRNYYNNKCAECGSPENLEVHHLNYFRFGREESEDLLLLCKKCHDSKHGN